MKKALLLCASHNDLGLIFALRKLGYYIMVTGNIPDLIGQKWCDEYIQADYSDKELILDIAKEKKVDVICQCCNDFGVYTASYVAEKLGLPGYDSYETTLLLHNKDKFKKFAKDNDIISPVSVSFSNKMDALKYIETVNYPIIIKPTDASAGNGIHKAENHEEAKTAIDFAYQKTRAGTIVIEPFIKGSQHGFCTFLIDQKVVACCSNNEYSFINPYRVEIDTFPADNYDKVSKCLIDQIEKIAKILKLKDGIFHLQYIFDGTRPQIIEVMRRILGNMYHVPGNMLTNTNWEYWETRAKCGLDCSGIKKENQQEGFYAYKSIVSTRNGVLKAITIPEQYKKYLLYTFYLRKPGYEIKKYQSDPIGFLFFMFPNANIMKEMLIDSYMNNFVCVE